MEKAKDNTNKEKEVIGICPECGGDVYVGDKAYCCNKSCGFFIYKKQSYFKRWTGRNIIKPQIRTLLKYGEIHIQCLKSDGTGTYPAIVKLEKTVKDEKSYWSLKRELIDYSQIEREVIGQCPKCGGDVYETPKGYRCSDKDCDFMLWKESKYFDNVLDITKAKAKQLLSRKSVPSFKLINKDGKEYEAYMKLVINGKYVNFVHVGFVDRKKKNQKHSGAMKLTKLKELREDAAMTQREIAYQLNITERTYSQYENGKVKIPSNILIKIADIFDVSLDYLTERRTQGQ